MLLFVFCKKKIVRDTNNLVEFLGPHGLVYLGYK